MARPKGTKYIETPEKLWELFEEYRDTIKPMIKIEYVGRDGDKTLTPLSVPYTFEGFECFLADKGVIQDLGDYSKDKDGRYTDYAPIITRIRNNCFVHNYNGAAVGLFNANLVANKLGIKQHTETTITSNVTLLNIDPLDDSNDSPTKDSSTKEED